MNPSVTAGTELRVDENFFCAPPWCAVGPCTVGKAVDCFGRQLSFIPKQRSDYADDSRMVGTAAGARLHHSPLLFKVNTMPCSKFTSPWNSQELVAKRRPLLTGIKALDTWHPLCRGWRSALIATPGMDSLALSYIGLDVVLALQSSVNKDRNPDTCMCLSAH